MLQPGVMVVCQGLGGQCDAAQNRGLGGLRPRHPQRAWLTLRMVLPPNEASTVLRCSRLGEAGPWRTLVLPCRATASR